MARTLGSMLSTDQVYTKTSELTNDDSTIKDEHYEDRVFTNAAEKSMLISSVTTASTKSGWIGAKANFTDPTAWQAELTEFVQTAKSRAPRAGDQVSVTDIENVYQYGTDNLWFLYASSKDGFTKHSQLTNDDSTVKDANYTSKVFTNAAERTDLYTKLASVENKIYHVGTMANFTDPSAYQAELTAFVTTTASRAPRAGDQVSVTGLNQVYQYGSDNLWFVYTTLTEQKTKHSQLTNDDHTVKDAHYSTRVFSTADEKTNTFNQIETNKNDIADLQAADVNLQTQIDALQKKTYWVGSMTNFTDPSAYEAELTAYVTSKMSRAPQEGDQVTVLDRLEVYQYSTGGEWLVFMKVTSGALPIATTSNLGTVQIGDGIDVDSDGVISVNHVAEYLDMTALGAINLEEFVEDEEYVPANKTVRIYAVSAEGGCSEPAYYRIEKKDDDNALVYAYKFTATSMTAYHKIKKGGVWGALTEETDKVKWGDITGDIEDEEFLYDDLTGGCYDRSKITDNCNYGDYWQSLSARQGKVLNEAKIGTADIADNLTTDDSTKVLSARQGKVLQDTKIDDSKIVDGLESDDATSVLSAKQAVVLNGMLTDGSVTRIGTANVGNALQHAYFANGVPKAGVQSYNKTLKCNGTSVSVLGRNNASGLSWYAPTTAGSSGQVLKSTGGTPSWGTISCSTSSSGPFGSTVLFSGYQSGDWNLDISEHPADSFDFISITFDVNYCHNLSSVMISTTAVKTSESLIVMLHNCSRYQAYDRHGECLISNSNIHFYEDAAFWLEIYSVIGYKYSVGATLTPSVS